MRRAISCLVLLLVTACGGAREAPAPSPGLALPDAFPHSMKGYVLYGWERDGEPWFTLITGTNRAKTFAELDDPAPLLGEDGFVRVRVRGVDQARELLRRVPDGEVFVAGIDAPHLAASTVPEGVRTLDPAVLDTLR